MKRSEATDRLRLASAEPHSEAAPLAIPHLAEPVRSRATMLHQHARANLRRHVYRAFVRVTTLLAVDLSTYFAVRQAMRTFRSADWLGGSFHGAFNQVFAEGYLGGIQYACALVAGLLVMGCYAPGDRRRDIQRLYLACTLATALSLWNDLWYGSTVVVASRFVATAIMFGTILVIARLAVDRLVVRYWHKPDRARTLLVGPAEECEKLLRGRMLSKYNGFDIVGFVDTAVPAAPRAHGQLGDLDSILFEECVDTVVLCGQMTERRLSRVVRAAVAAECHVLSRVRSFSACGIQAGMVWHGGEPFVELRAPTLQGRQLLLKRAVDVAIAATGLLLSAPLLALIALAVRLDSPGPIIFRQLRLGRHGRIFRCLKFRSMYVDAEERLRANEELYALYVAGDYKLPEDLDNRITRVGRFLRRTSLDELPQLFNVLRGDMSLVGPRPIVPDELRHYPQEGPLLLSLRPGITGQWQVNGRSTVSYPIRADLELDYVQSWSITKDFKIMLQTLPVVLGQKGAH
jgi:exopolysaccharide biosynthesis polyprenyl glycosylphosphotransferase